MGGREGRRNFRVSGGVQESLLRTIKGKEENEVEEEEEEQEEEEEEEKEEEEEEEEEKVFAEIATVLPLKFCCAFKVGLGKKEERKKHHFANLIGQAEDAALFMTCCHFSLAFSPTQG